MSQIQKFKKTPAKKSALDATHDDALSQTVDTEIELGSQKASKTPKNRRRKTASGSQEEESSQSTEPVTPVRSKSKVDEEEEIETAAPKRKATPAPKKSAKKSSDKDAAPKKTPTRGFVKGQKRAPPQMVKTAEGDFQTADIETFDLMRRSEPILPRAAFLRVVKEVVRDLQPDFRLSAEGFDILQTATEDALTDTFFVANMLSLSRKKQTINQGDIRMASLIKGITGTGLHQHTTYDMKKIMEAYGYKREDLAIGNTGPDLIAQQGMLKLELMQAEKDKKAGKDTKPKKKKSKDIGDEDYVREKKDDKKKEKAGDKRKKKDDGEDGEDDEEPVKKKKKVVRKAVEEASDEEEY